MSDKVLTSDRQRKAIRRRAQTVPIVVLVLGLLVGPLGLLPAFGQGCYAEWESNDAIEWADLGDPIPGWFCVNGEITRGNVDYFAFDVSSAYWVTIETSLYDAGDTTLLLIDERGAQIAYNDDDPGGGAHSFINECLGPGRYYVVVGSYDPTATFPYVLYVEGVEPCGIGPALTCDYWEIEPNDSIEWADIGSSVPGSFCFDGEITRGNDDYFGFDVVSDHWVTITTSLSDVGDTTLTLLDEWGYPIAYNDDDPSGGAHSYIDECLAPGRYYLVVGSYDPTASFAYALRVESDDPCGVGPKLTCDYAEAEWNDSIEQADPGGQIPGSFCFDAEIIKGNEDYFSFDVSSDHWVTIQTSLSDVGDTTLTLLDESGKQIAYNDDDPGGGTHSYLHECLQRGRYYAVIGSYDPTASFPYVLSVEGVDPCVSEPCLPPAEPNKVIVTPFGDVTQATSFVGETVKFRILYFNSSAAPADIQITDALDSALAVAKVLNNGQYDAATHTVTWNVAGVPSCHGGFVEFEAVVGSTATIENRARTQVGGSPETLTNPVKLTVCSPKLGWVPFVPDSVPNGRPAIQMKDETTAGLLVCFDVPGMFVNEVVVDGTVFHRLSVPGFERLGDVGRPEVPILGAIVEIPSDAAFTINIVEQESIELDCYNVYPAQEPIPEHALYVAPPLVLDQATYTSSVNYPGLLAEVTPEDVGIVRGHRLVFLKVNPIQYNPATRKITAFSRIEVGIEYLQPSQIEAPSPDVLSQPFEEMLEAAVLNFRPAEERYMMETEAGETTEQTGCNYLIITHDGFYDKADASNPVVELAEWKRQKGLSTMIVRISDIGNTPAKIRSYIETAYTTWATKPTYVLLIGDADHIAPDYRNVHPSTTRVANGGHVVNWGTANQRQTQIGTDLYYATVDGSDPFPDLFLGRISAESANDVEAVVDKIIAYEKNPPAANAAFYGATSLVRLFEDDSPSNRQEDVSWVLIELAEELRTFLVGQGYAVDRIYSFSGGHAQGPGFYEDGTALPAGLTFGGGFMWDGDDEDIIGALNAGRFLLTYRGHGWNDGWGNPNFSSGTNGVNLGDFDDVPTALSNAGITPIVFGLTCRTGWFDSETDDGDLPTYYDCFAEELLRWGTGGAAAVVASSRNSWGAYNNPMTTGMCDALWPGLDTTFAGDPLSHAGEVLTYGKLFMAARVGHSDGRLATLEMTHLFGDPEMVVLTAAPPELDADHPVGIGSTGTQDFVVRVTVSGTANPVGSAVVSLTRPGEIIGSGQTDAGGVARFSMKAVGNGDLKITVTSPGMRPYEGTIEVASGGAEINVLDPGDGVTGSSVDVGGVQFSAGDTVGLRFAGQAVDTFLSGAKVSNVAADSGGAFGQTGNVGIVVPASASLGPANVEAHGQPSDRYAVDVFQVRSATPVELYTYSQEATSTWHLAGGKKTWNSPSIQLYSSAGAPVSSNNLTALQTYTIHATVYNKSAFVASNVLVTFEWANFGVGQRIWTPIGTPVSIDVPAATSTSPGTAVAQIQWEAKPTGHICLRASAYHVEDTDDQDNRGQENTHVGTTSSPATIPFEVTNNTDEPGMVFFEIRQLGYSDDPEHEWLLWPCWVVHPDPQLLQPGETRQVRAMVDAPAGATSGAQAEFALTAYLNGQTLGGISFTIMKQ